MSRTDNVKNSQQLLKVVVGGKDKAINNEFPSKISINPYVFNLPRINAKNSITNFKEFCKTYKKGLVAKNKVINQHNISVEKYIDEKPLNDTKSSLVDLFIIDNKPLINTEYNELVASFCKKHGNIIKKRKLQPVRASSFTQILFSQFVHRYANKVHDNNSRLQLAGLNTSRKIEKLSVNLRTTANYFNVEIKTIRNQIKRLMEAGIIKNTQFCGSRAPIKVRLNVDILDIIDHGISKNAIIDYQSTKPQLGKNIPNKSIITRTNIKRNKKKENVDNIFNVSGSMPKAISQSTLFYKNTNTLDVEKKSLGAEKTKKVSPKKQIFSQILENQLKDDRQLAKNMFDGDYTNYKTEIFSHLEKELTYKTLSLNVFRLIIIQEMIKLSSKLYTNNTLKPYQGAWLNFIRNWQNENFTDKQGNIKNTREFMYNFLKEFNWRVDWAKKEIKRVNKTDLLFPNDYFDPKRNLPSEYGFSFTRRKYNTEQNRLAKREEKKKQQHHDHLKRARETKKNQQIERAIGKFTNGTYDKVQLFEYFDNAFKNDLNAQMPMIKSMLLNNKKVN